MYFVLALWTPLEPTPRHCNIGQKFCYFVHVSETLSDIFCFRPRTFSFQNGCMYGMDEHGLSNIIQYVFGMCLICYPENVNVHKWKKVDKMYIYIIQQQQAKLNTTLIIKLNVFVRMYISMLCINLHTYIPIRLF